MKVAVQEAKSGLVNWSTSLTEVSGPLSHAVYQLLISPQLKIERKAGDAALKEMTQNVAARLDVKLRKGEPRPRRSAAASPPLTPAPQRTSRTACSAR